MAIAPIDLQTMYSQINNVAKIVNHQTNGAQLAEALQQNSVIQQNLEKAAAVQKTAQNDAKSSEVNVNGRGSGDSRRDGKNTKKKKSGIYRSDGLETDVRESYLGQNVDITR